MKRCESGHYYDTAKHTTCPLCAAVDISGVVGAARPTTPHAPNRSDVVGDGKTVAVMKKEHGIDPVVGWFVCVKGPDRGSDFRIKGEKNFVGRGPSMDIRIPGDETISRENHAIVSYNPRKRSFKLHPGEGRGIVYVNGEEVDAPRELAKSDMVEIGRTTLMFVPLCGDDFDWTEEDHPTHSR